MKAYLRYRLSRALLANRPAVALRAAMMHVSAQNARGLFRDAGHMGIFDALAKERAEVEELLPLLLLLVHMQAQV